MFFKRLIRLLFGIFLFALGIVLSIKANLGVAPWDAFHLGITYITGISFGLASMSVGLFILCINYFIGEKIGIGTILNIFGIGLIIDFLFYLNIIPTMTTLFSGIISIFISMIIIAIGSYYYIGAGFGAGPRDGLMVGLVKKTGLKIGFIRGIIELSALGIGYALGSKVGLGTLILGFAIGPIVQVTFKFFKFNVKDIHHQYLELKRI